MGIVGKSSQSYHIKRIGWFLTLMMILLLGAALRFHMMAADVRFHPDEALFSTFARNAAVHGDWMFTGPLDKTPASLYASALSMHFLTTYQNRLGVLDMDVRQGEFAARLPNVLLSLILIALTASLAGNQQRKRAQVVAAFLITCSPYVLVFSASAFTDMGMVTFGMLALVAVLRSSGWLVGLSLALSIAFKQQGVIFLPLVIILTWQHGQGSWRWWLGWGLAVILGIGLLLIWDAARPGTSVFSLAAANNHPEGIFASPAEWLPRLKTWSGYAGWLLGPPLVTFPLLTFTTAYVILRGQRLDWLLGGFCVVYFILHWLVDFNPYDRYLLPLVPLLAICTARATLLHPLSSPVAKGKGSVMGIKDISGVVSESYPHPKSFSLGEKDLLPSLSAASGRGDEPQARWGEGKKHFANNIIYQPYYIIVGLIVTGVLIITIIQTSRWEFDLGRDHYPLDRAGEIISAADYLNQKPPGTILYDPWLGWELGYYMGSWSNKRHVHYPTPDSLVADAIDNPETAPRYFVAPPTQNIVPWLDALTDAGFDVQLEFENGQALIYRITSDRQTSAS